MSDIVPIRQYPALPISFHHHHTSAIISDQFGSRIADLSIGQRSEVAQLARNASVTDTTRPNQYILGTGAKKTVVRETPVQLTLEQRVFDSGVQMKVAVAQYAMHLTPETRHKLFHDLDDVVNVADWYEEDPLPRHESFRDFLKWTIYSKRFNWLSIRVSDEGNILVAWRSARALLTANFGGNSRVLWTANRTSPDGGIHTAGDSPLQFFEKEATLYLD